MPSTYSIYVGQVIESTRKPDIFDALSELPNNTQKLISPRDVRDAFLTTWSNSSFKITTGSTFSSYEYIGLDSGNPDDRDIKQRILIGKRSFGNLDIMNDSLLNSSNADIFLYNTKPDSVTQSSTKVAILAGTNSILHLYAPYIEASTNVMGDAIDLNITNPSLFGGDINILSTTGRVAINGIVFPTAAETSASASNGKILRYFGTYPSGSMAWDDSIVTISDIGSPGTETNIYGSPVLLNGQSLEFVDTSLVPITIGGITQGASFPTGSFIGQDWPLSEVLRQILYPYIEPVLELSIINPITGTTYAEAGTTPSLEFDWSITTYARDNNESISDFFIRESLQSFPNFISFGSSFSAVPSSVTSSSFTYVTYSSGISSLDFSIDVSTVVGITASAEPFGYSFSSTQTVSFINPIFYSFDTTEILSGSYSTLQTVASGATKLIEPVMASHSYILPYNGSGYLYFIYPNTFGATISYIKDPNGYTIYDYGFTYSIFTHSSMPFSPDYTGSFEIWRTIATCSYTGSENFEIIFL